MIDETGKQGIDRTERMEIEQCGVNAKNYLEQLMLTLYLLHTTNLDISHRSYKNHIFLLKKN